MNQGKPRKPRERDIFEKEFMENSDKSGKVSKIFRYSEKSQEIFFL